MLITLTRVCRTSALLIRETLRFSHCSHHFMWYDHPACVCMCLCVERERGGRYSRQIQSELYETAVTADSDSNPAPLRSFDILAPYKLAYYYYYYYYRHNHHNHLCCCHTLTRSNDCHAHARTQPQIPQHTSASTMTVCIHLQVCCLQMRHLCLFVFTFNRNNRSLKLWQSYDHKLVIITLS